MTPQDNSQDVGASASPSGSRASHGAQEVSTLTGFDPSRIEDYRDFSFARSFSREAPHMGWAAEGLVITASRKLSVACTNNGLSSFTGWTDAGFNYCPSAPWQDWVALAERILDVENRRHAIAIEAQRAVTTQIGTVEDESAGPQDIAQPEPSS